MATTTCDADIQEGNALLCEIQVEERKRGPEDDNGDVLAKKAKTECVNDKDLAANGITNVVPRKKKCALLISYCGVGYAGMQINPGVRTIEEQLINALHQAEVITDDAKECLGKMSFQRCARTDKGVSAARQVVSLKSLLPKINSFLPPEIRIFGMIKTTKAFDCKQNCSARTYEYLTPTFAFAKDYQSTVGYRITAEKIEEINKALSNYKGTKNYHNFTSGKKFEDPSANRYIISFKCGKPFERNGREFVVLTVKGQSFVLHQIRKMIGLVIAVVRGVAPSSTFDLVWAKKKIDIPKAPALGLVLDTVHFDAYNKKFGNDGLHEPLDWQLINEEVYKFKEDFIHKHIIDTETKEHTMMRWLNTLSSHTYTGEGMEEIGSTKGRPHVPQTKGVAEDNVTPHGTLATKQPEIKGEDCKAGDPAGIEPGKEIKMKDVLQEKTASSHLVADSCVKAEDLHQEECKRLDGVFKAVIKTDNGHH